MSKVTDCRLITGSVPPVGEYPGLQTGNKVRFTADGVLFELTTEDYVKGVKCACSVIVTETGIEIDHKPKKAEAITGPAKQVQYDPRPGSYDGTISGYQVRFYDNNGHEFMIGLVEGYRGINIPCKVLITEEYTRVYLK